MVPTYPNRGHWRPATASDFGDGGAYPEIHVAQFPLGLGRGGAPTALNKLEILVHDQPSLVPRHIDEALLVRPAEEDREQLALDTAAAIAAKLSKKRGMSQLAKASQQVEDKFLRYIPDPEAPGYNPQISERIIRVVEKPVDPLEPPKFKRRKAHIVSAEEPVPILREPPRKLTPEEKQAWNIPPVISSWINPAGHAIPLEMRIQADRRDLQQVEVNPKFASFSEALYIAERVAREELKLKQDILKQKAQEAEKERETKLRDLAAKARLEKAALLKRNAARRDVKSESEDDVER